ncbi:MAG: glycosyltransferase family 39 protein [Patescibacteria group bacterium]
MFDIFQICSRVREFLTKKDVLWLLFLLLAFLATRLINLEKFPIFSDEAIYIHWAKEAWHDASLRFISLTDGKQPLQTWGTIPFLKLFPDNMLLGGRLFAVMNGFLALTGIGTLLNYLFGKKAAFWGMVFYVFTPYFIFYDRLALVDSGVNAAVVWILFFSIWLANKRELSIALFFGIVAGIGLLAKSSVRIFLGLSAFAPVLFFEKSFKKFIPNTINYFVLFVTSAVTALVIYNVQRLSPYMHIVAEKNKTFVMTFSDFFQTPFKYFFRNLELIPHYVLQESAFVLPLLGLIGLILLIKNKPRLGIYFALWIIIPFFVVCFLSIVLYPRYIIFFSTLLLVTSAYLLSIQKNKAVLMGLVAIFFVSVAYFDYTILFAPKQIPLVPIDRSQYLEEWPAGWGIKEIVQYSREKSKEKPVIIIAEGNFGMASDSLDSSLKRSDTNISIWGRWPVTEKDIEDASNQLKDHYVYLVLSQQKSIPTNWNTKLIQKFDKPGNISSVYFLELLPQ